MAMRFLIVPLGLLQRGAEKILGKKELEDLSSDLVLPVAKFADEIYEDTVGDVAKRFSRLSRRKDKMNIKKEKET